MWKYSIRITEYFHVLLKPTVNNGTLIANNNALWLNLSSTLARVLWASSNGICYILMQTHERMKVFKDISASIVSAYMLITICRIVQTLQIHNVQQDY